MNVAMPALIASAKSLVATNKRQSPRSDANQSRRTAGLSTWCVMMIGGVCSTAAELLDNIALIESYDREHTPAGTMFIQRVAGEASFQIAPAPSEAYEKSKLAIGDSRQETCIESA